MSDFKRPVATKVELPEWLATLYESGLRKDLNEHEGVCPFCNGVGWEVTDQVFNLSDNPDRRPPYFPFHNQYLIPCRHCYTGVIHYCEHCGKELPKGRCKCDCDAVKSEDKAKEAAKEAELLEKAEKFPSSALGDKFGMCFSEYFGHNEGFFSEWQEFFEEWYDLVHDDNDGVEPERPKYVWGTDEEMIQIDASDVVDRVTEDLWEGAREQISDKDLDELQDYLDKWCAQQLGTKTYMQSYKSVVEIPWEKYGE